MRTSLALFVSAVALAACQSAPEKTALVEEPRERCDTAQTGSRIPQCNRGDVRTITRDEMERDGYTHRGTDLPGSPPRGR